MRRCKQLIKSMLIVIFLSLIIIFLCEGEQFGNIRSFVVYKLRFLSGKRESVENIFIGILGSSVVTLIGYILEYFQSIKTLQKDIEMCYMDVRYKLFPYIDGSDAEIIYKIRKDEYKLELLDCDICSRYVKAVFIISVLTNHFFILNRNLLCKKVYLDEYKKEYKSLKNIVEKKELDKILNPLREQYKAFIQSDKDEKEYIEKLRLNEACKILDAHFAFDVFK